MGEAISSHAMYYPHLANPERRELPDAIRTRNAAVQTLGNLTLLNQYLNPAASNGSFEEKLVEYKHSVLRLNRHFDAAKEWDEHSIAARGKALGEALCRIWPRPMPEPEPVEASLASTAVTA